MLSIPCSLSFTNFSLQFGNYMSFVLVCPKYSIKKIFPQQLSFNYQLSTLYGRLQCYHSLLYHRPWQHTCIFILDIIATYNRQCKAIYVFMNVCHHIFCHLYHKLFSCSILTRKFLSAVYIQFHNCKQYPNIHISFT